MVLGCCIGCVSSLTGDVSFRMVFCGLEIIVVCCFVSTLRAKYFFFGCFGHAITLHLCIYMDLRYRSPFVSFSLIDSYDYYHSVCISTLALHLFFIFHIIS